MRKLDCLLINAQNRAIKMKENVKEFFTSEKGISNVVATIILLLIVVILIGIFWDRLQTWLSGLMGQIFDTEIKGDKL